jgi:uncharacterized phage protein (TIGR02218 family)
MIASHDSLLNEACWILPFAPEWSAGIETRFTLPMDAERGLTGRESRWAYAEKLRCEMVFESLLTASEACALRNALQNVDFENRPIWFPFWPGEYVPGSTSAFRSAQALFWQDNSSASLIQNPAAISGSFSEQVRLIPALRGYFAESPRVEALTDELFVARFHLKEAGPLEMSLRANSSIFALGPEISGRKYPIFPFSPRWGGSIETVAAGIEVERREIGFSREPVRIIYPQHPERTLSFDLNLYNNQSGADLIEFFNERQAGVGAFWCPTWVSDTRLLADVPPGTMVLTVSDYTAMGENAYIALVDRDSTEVFHVASKSVRTLTLDSLTRSAHLAETTSLTTAALVRFTRPTLSIEWMSTDEVKASVEVREVPYDYYTPTGETHGSSIGALETTCYLFRFSIKYPTITQLWCYTSYEQSLVFEGNTHTAVAIEAGEIRETLNLERNEIQIRTHAFEGNPLLRFVPFRLEFPMKLEIFEGQRLGRENTPHTCTRIFSGEVTRVNFEGPSITASAVTVGNLFERRIPKKLLQPTCNYALFDPLCGLSLTDWKFQGFVIEIVENPTRVHLSNLSRVSGTWILPDEHWFASGWIEIGTGTQFESRFVTDSTTYNPDGNGWIQITVATPFTKNPVAGDLVTIFPGCDGKHTTCKNRFNRYSSFGGFPFMPVGNPSMVKMPDNRNMK